MTDDFPSKPRSVATVRLGLVGTGYWVEEIHRPTCKLSEDLDLVGIWRRNRDRGRALAAKLAIIAFDGFEDSLEAVDAVSIVVAPDAPAKLALAPAPAGKHLFVEKPLATSNEDATRIEVLSRAPMSPRFSPVCVRGQRPESTGSPGILRLSSDPLASS